VSPAATGQLELRETSSRLVALLRERQKLLANVTRKKGKLEKLLATLDAQHAQMAQMASAAQPLLAQGQEIDREVHGLFAAILARTSLNRKDRQLIQDLYEMLQLEGTGPANGQPKDPDYEPEIGDLEDLPADILMPSGFGAPGPRTPRSRRRR
jgi:hypothetical protein